MTAPRSWPVLAFCTVLPLAQPRLAMADVKAGTCGIAAGGDAMNNTITCNFGLTPEQLREVTKAAVAGATGSLLDRIEKISGVLGVTRTAAEKLLKIAGEQPDVPDERLAEVLSKIAADYDRLKAQAAALDPDNPGAKALVQQAQIEIEAGHLDHAHDLLRQATRAQVAAAEAADKLAQQARAVRDAQRLGAAGSTATEARVALTERNYRRAAELFAEAATYIPDGYRNERLDNSFSDAYALFLQGSEGGDSESLSRSIEIYRQIITERSRKQESIKWADAQIALGMALSSVADRPASLKEKLEALEKGVAANQAVLEELTHDRAPREVIHARNNLGYALVRLGDIINDERTIRKGLALHIENLQLLSKESSSEDWARAEINIGYVYSIIGGKYYHDADFEKSVAAFQQAMTVWNRDKDKEKWRGVESQLALALLLWGKSESGTARLEESVTAYRAALEGWTRERHPLVWASTQNNLGTALQVLGERESGTERLEQAVAAYRAALQERTRELVPLDWATTQNNLGNALRTLGERESGTAHLEQAVAAWDACLTITAAAWPAERVQSVRSQREATQRMIAQRSAQ